MLFLMKELFEMFKISLITTAVSSETSQETMEWLQ